MECILDRIYTENSQESHQKEEGWNGLNLLGCSLCGEEHV